MDVYTKTAIFRPWDATNRSQNKIFRQCDDQDCTISTTTDNDVTENTVEIVKSCETSIKNEEKSKLQPSIELNKQNKQTNMKRKTKDEKKQKRNVHTVQNKTQNTQVQSPSEITRQYNDLYFNVPLIDTPASHIGYPNPYDYASLISGVDSCAVTTPTAGSIDPIVMESLALHGYAAMEEYVRIINHEQQTKLLNNRKQRPKKYKCPHCDVGFSNNGQLRGHIRIHTGERPFRCDEKNCGKTFTRNEELTRHKRIHSGLRPFPCSACGKRFGRKDHLKKHTKTHITANQRNGLQLVPVVLPAGAWASIPPTSGIPMYNPTVAATSFHHTAPMFPYPTVPTSVTNQSAALYGF